MNRRGLPMALLALAVVAAGKLACAADSGSAGVLRIEAVRVGFNDCYKTGVWTPVEVVVGGACSATLEVRVTVADGDGVPCRFARLAARGRALADGRRAVGLVARFGRVRGTMDVELVEPRGTTGEPFVLARQTLQTAATADAGHIRPAIDAQKLIVVVGSDAAAVEEAVQLQGLEADRRPVVARVGSLAELPADWHAYEGAAAVVILAGRHEGFAAPPGQPEQYAPQVAALDDWVRQGGRLTLCVGDHGAELLGPDGALRALVPGRFERMTDLAQTGAIEKFGRSTAPIPAPPGSGPTLRAPRLAQVEGIVEAREADLPLVVRAPRGMGQVVFLAAALDAPPLAGWKDRALLTAALLDLPSATVEETVDLGGGLSLGFADLAGQLRSSLDRFEAVWLTPCWLIALLLIVYTLWIGPVEYFFFRRYARRMKWTWLTFPAVVLLFCGLMAELARKFKGDVVRVRLAEVVDVDVSANTVRGSAWFNLFSPRATRYDLALEPRLPGGAPTEKPRVLMGWLGLPGKGLGGMDQGHQAFEPTSWAAPYGLTPEGDALCGVPMAKWSSKSFAARWTAAGPPGIEADLRLDGQVAVGTIVSRLPFALEQAVLAVDRWAYVLGTLTPGETVQLGPMSKASGLDTYLTGRKLVLGDTSDKFRQETTPYNQTSLDPAYILRTMAFYEAAGGRHYVGLANDYQAFVDLSPLVRAGRAVLVGQAPAAAGGARLSLDDQPLDDEQLDRTLIYRFVITLKQP